MSDTKHLYILLTDTGTMFTRLIKRITAAPYNHASIALDGQLNEVFSFGRKCADNPWVGGFVEEDVYEGTFSHFPGTRCALLRFAVTQQQYDQVRAVIQRYKDEEDAYRYNLIGLFGVLMRLDITRERSYFCSQFVAETLRQSGIRLWDRSSTLVTPHDFLLHPSMELVYEGMLYDYPLLDQTRLASFHHPLQSAAQ